MKSKSETPKGRSPVEWRHTLNPTAASQALCWALLLCPWPLYAALPSFDGGPPVPVVDMHTHVFNVRDLPVVELLDALAPEKLPARRAVAEALGGIFLRLTPQNESVRGIREFNLDAPDVPPSELPPITLTASERRTLVGSLNEPTWKADVFAQPNEVRAFESDEDLFAGGLLQVGFPPRESILGKIINASSALKGILAFARVMMNRDVAIANQLRRSEYPNVDLFVHHMMDMERGYGAKPSVSFSNQIVHMDELDKKFDGKFLHFVAFDPFRRDPTLAMVKHGLAGGAIGVKFYPATGYSPTNNIFPPRPTDKYAATRWDSRYKNFTPKELDDLNDLLFRYCEEKRIPVFTHCTPLGFEAGKGYGWNADPTNWAQVLVAHPNLFLCFGHSGGEAYWFADAKRKSGADEPRSRSFGTNVVELCLRYPNVYCEVGYLEDILELKMIPVFTKRLLSVIGRKSTAGNWAFGDKIMYGTDWHMIHKQADHRRYTDQFNKVFSRSGLKYYHRRFFSGNAVRFLQLDQLANQPRFTKAQQDYWRWLISRAQTP